MRQLFDLDSPLMVGLTRIADIIILNILFLVCCIPVFTIGPAITAMYYVTLKMVRNEDCYIVKSFFKSFKQNFKQAVAIWMIILATITVVAIDFRIIDGGASDLRGLTANVSGAVLIVLFVTCIIISFVVSYVFPILAKFDNTVKNTIKNAFFMSMRHLPYTILIILINIIPYVVVYFAPASMLFFVMSFALCAYGCSFIFNRIFNIYAKAIEITPDMEFSIDSNEESFLFNKDEKTPEEE